ncbi:hypothetical protein HD554DRAFT_2177405 [Boletus coccyginus]|nr:hypothetical protein HD554DRAFT_2177405 [Boletus coccyginus]
MSNNNPVVTEEENLQQLFNTFLNHTAFDAAITGGGILPPPPPPPSPPLTDPGDVQVFDPMFMEMADLFDQDLYTDLANILGFPNLPGNWKRILYHAYNEFFTATALQRCEESNPLWAAEEDEMIYIGDVQVHASMSGELFRDKLYASVGNAEWAFHNHTLQRTIHLLSSRPGQPGLMPHLPGPAGTMFNINQRAVVSWYLTWDATQGYIIWHNIHDSQIHWFDNVKLRNLLHCALTNANSPGYFGFQEPYQAIGGIWTWRPLQAQGAAALSILSYALACVSVSMRSDFLQEHAWDQDVSCPRRRVAILEEQVKIYNFLTSVATLSVPALHAVHRQHARDGLVALLDCLGYTL